MRDHLVVIQHGMCATPDEVSNLKRGLEGAFPGRLRAVLVDVNRGRTTDGVAASGARLAELVRGLAPAAGGCVSFVGHSMGGVVARWAVKVLEEEGWFDASGVRAANFVTTASPHLGIADIGACWRLGASLLGGVLGATVRDLSLQTGAMAELTGEAALRGLRRFARRAAYGNLADDVGVRPCTSLMLPSRPVLPNLEPGMPHAIPPSHAKALLSSADLADSFPAQHIPAVRDMLGRLDTVAWERYAVHFPYRPELGWRGDAHHKICNHGSWDRNNCGARVVAHMCEGFAVDPARHRL